jgi:hypothetical protein
LIADGFVADLKPGKLGAFAKTEVNFEMVALHLRAILSLNSSSGYPSRYEFAQMH